VTKISKRLRALASFIDKEDVVADVGCDHGLLSIYLVENNLCRMVIATDVNAKALNNARNNISKRNLDITTYLSDGIRNIPLDGLNTLIISGMGTKTILHILEDDKALKNINKLVIQSNNDLALLRKELNNKGFYLEDEEEVEEKGKWYIINLFVKSDKKNDKQVLLYGYLKDKLYANYLSNSLKKIWHKIPFTSFKAKYQAFRAYNQLKKTISKLG